MTYINPNSTVKTAGVRNSALNVENLNAFADQRVGDIITLVGDIAYTITRDFSFEEVEFVMDEAARITIIVTNEVANGIVSEILPGRTLFSGPLSRLEFKGADFTLTNGGELFDFTAGDDLFPVLFVSNSRILNSGKVGTLNGVSLALENVGYALNDDGWDLTDAAICTIAEQNIVLSDGISYKFSGTTGSVYSNIVQTAPASVDVTYDFSGTLGTAIINGLVATPVASGSVFNIDSGITINGAFQIIGGSVDLSAAGSTMFKAGSLDQTDPKIVVDLIHGVKSSRWISENGFEDNTTVTTLSVGVPTDVEGTFAPGKTERHSYSGGVTTYTGLEDITETVIVSASIVNGVGGGRRTIKVHLLLDTGSGHSIVSSRTLTMGADAIPLSYPTELDLSTGYKYKAQVENVENGEGILVIDISVRGKK